MPTPVEFFCCDQDVVKVGQKAKSVKSIVYPPITGGFEAGGDETVWCKSQPTCKIYYLLSLLLLSPDGRSVTFPVRYVLCMFLISFLPVSGAGVTKYFDPKINSPPQGVTNSRPETVMQRLVQLLLVVTPHWANIIYTRLDHSTGNHYDCVQSLTSI